MKTDRGLPYINCAPNLTLDVPALTDLPGRLPWAGSVPGCVARR